MTYRKLLSFRKSEFVLNTFTVLSGSFISQLIPIVSAPVLARIYSPSHYGILGIYVSVSSLIGIISTFQYHNAILIPKNDEEAIALLQLSVRNALITACASILFVIFFGRPLLHLINAENTYRWLVLLPISVFFTGINLSFSAFAVRCKLFRLSSYNKILGSLIALIFSLAGAFFYKDESGLMWGFIIGQAISSMMLATRLMLKHNLKPSLLFLQKRLHNVAGKYKHFPQYSLPTDLLNNFTNQIPVFLINSFGGQIATGLFNMCNRLLSLPQVFLSNSLGEVFRQRAAHDFNHIGTFDAIFIKTAKILIALSIVPFIILLIWGPDLFALFLGEKWRTAGVFARILSPLFVLRFINSPLSYTLYLQGKLKFDLLATIYLNISSIILLVVALKYYHITVALGAYVVNYCLTYLFMFYKSYTFSKLINPAYGKF